MRGAFAAAAVVAIAALPDRDDPRLATASFLAELRPASAAAARFEFADPLRLDWHFIPRDRHGLPLREMDAAERRATHRLLRSLLSPLGYERALGVIELESVLRRIENNPGRDPGAYWVSVFGEPATAADTGSPTAPARRPAPFMVRFEGHHLSLNWTGAPTGEVSATPFFIGANPAEVLDGEDAGRRLLSSFETKARALIHVLGPELRARCIVAASAPADVLFGPGATPPDLAAGLDLAAMPAAAAEMARQLAAEMFSHVMDAARPEARPSLLPDGKPVDGRFAWAGGLAEGMPHYWRLVLGDDVIEFDNTQNGANHVHLLWRNMGQDFAAGWLTRHHQEQHRR
jgi:hypothetical protein